MQKNYNENHLKPYAVRSINCKGRIYKEPENSTRSPYQRDRDRIIHSSSFRRLKHKTQVFVNTEGDHYRTRLTHSMEVSQIARTLARSLGLNEDISETLSLSHDLGHTPFGHAGEEVLSQCMKRYGGFNHNIQTLRIVTSIENKYYRFCGLNLTIETLDGLIKHNGPIKNIDLYKKILNKNLFNNKISFNTFPTLEAQVAAISDDIAYNNHDLEDAIRAGLITINELNEISFFKEIIYEIKNKYNKINENHLTYQVLRKSISTMISDIYYNTKKNLQKFEINSYESIRNHSNFLVSMSKKMNDNSLSIKDFLFENVYNNNSLMIKRKKAEEIIIKLFDYYKINYDKLPKDWKKIKSTNEERNICDYISGMTDRFALNLYNSIYE